MKIKITGLSKVGFLASGEKLQGKSIVPNSGFLLPAGVGARKPKASEASMNWHLSKKNGKNGNGGNGFIIRMEGIRKVYDTGKVQVEALKDIHLSVKKGEFVAVVGPSGSGKSTLMNLIGCLDTPSGGEYYLADEAVSGLGRDQLADVRNRKVGFVFQNFNLLPQISAYENVELPMLFGGLAKGERQRRTAELLGRVGLEDRMDHKPTELSGGQMQRVAIARAMAMEPAILLADEPTGNLDTTAGGDIMTLFSELWAQGRTLVVVTHDMALARRAGRVVEIRDGLVVRDETNAPPA